MCCFNLMSALKSSFIELATRRPEELKILTDLIHFLPLPLHLAYEMQSTGIAKILLLTTLSMLQAFLLFAGSIDFETHTLLCQDQRLLAAVFQVQHYRDDTNLQDASR